MSAASRAPLSSPRAHAALGAARGLALIAALAGCGGERARGGASERARGGAAARAGAGPAVRGRPVARIGSGASAEVVTDEEVAAAARAEGLTDPRRALEHAVRARLLAREARRRGLDENYPAVADTERRGTIQTLLVEDVERRVRADTVPADVMAQGMALRAFDLAHGELWRTQHVVVRVPEHADAAAHARARAAAEQFRERALALPPPRGGQAFEALADEALRGIDHRVETLPPCDANGRMARGALDPAYVRAAAALQAPGDVSPVTETSFGYHVIVLLGRLPPVVRTDDEVAALVREEAVWRLRHRALDELLNELRVRYGTRVRDEALRAVERVRIDAPDEPAAAPVGRPAS